MYSACQARMVLLSNLTQRLVFCRAALAGRSGTSFIPAFLLHFPAFFPFLELYNRVVQEYAAATAEAEMAEAKSVRQGEEAEAFRRIADEKRLLAYQLADKWTGLAPLLLMPYCLDRNSCRHTVHVVVVGTHTITAAFVS